MNLYATLSDMKEEMQRTSTTDDALILRLLGSVSRGVDRVCRRRFYAEVAQTAYYDAKGGTLLPLGICANEPFRADLISATVGVDVDRDETYEYTLVANTDYYLARKTDGGSYRALEIAIANPQLSVFPTGRRTVRLSSATFGFSDDTTAVGTLSAGINSSVTSLTHSGTLSAGDTIIIGTERMYVSASSAGTVTVTRGVNGSTAANHSLGDAITKVVFPTDVSLAVRMQTARIIREVSTGQSGQIGGDAAGFTYSASYPIIRDLLQPYMVHEWR